MESRPNYLTAAMQEHAMQASSSIFMSSPYSIAMEEAYLQSCNYLPQASMAVASPYMGPFINDEENYGAMHDQILLKMDNFEQTIPMHAEPIVACAYPSLPLSASTELAPLSPSFPFEQGQYLLNLQALLKSQYDISLSLDQLLAFDALPALLQTDSDGQAPQNMATLKVEDPQQSIPAEAPALEMIINHDHLLLNEALQVSQAAGVSISAVHNKTLSVGDSYVRPQDMSSPGSAASSSVLTEGDHSDKPPPADYIAAAIPRMPSPLASVSSQSWMNPTISWLPGEGDVTTVLQALNEMQVMEAPEEPPAQRRKLQGITLEQVMQAERMQQQVNGNHPLQAPSCNPFLGTDMAAAVEKGVGGGLYELNGVRDGSNQIPSPILPQPRKPAATSVEPQSVAARYRRKRIRERTESLGMIIPGATRLDTAAMFDLAIKYVHFLQAQMFCLENEVSLTQQQRLSYEDETVAGFRRALIHRLLSSQDVQHFLSREGLCLVTEGLASRLKFDPSSISLMKKPGAADPPPPPPPLSRAS